MSSNMRRRRSLMGLSLIGGSCLEAGVLGPSILKTERLPRHLISNRRSDSLSSTTLRAALSA
jgi:hypothetical protein